MPVTAIPAGFAEFQEDLDAAERMLMENVDGAEADALSMRIRELVKGQKMGVVFMALCSRLSEVAASSPCPKVYAALTARIVAHMIRLREEVADAERSGGTAQ